MTQDSKSVARKENKPSRREVLRATAQELFAHRGIDAVSLNEINKAAGQRNTSAMHYHFGSKEGLVEAIIYEHYADIDLQIIEQLDRIESLPETERTTRELLKALITPFTRQLDTPQGINYLLIVRQVLMKSSDMLVKGHPAGKDRARLRSFRLFQHLMIDLPVEIRPARLVLCAGLIFNALATYAQSQKSSEGALLGSKALFVNNLLDNLESLITLPPSGETMAALKKKGS